MRSTWRVLGWILLGAVLGVGAIVGYIVWFFRNELPSSRHGDYMN